MASLSANDLFNVKDMVFVITGGGSGIGKMIADALDENGAAKVYILGRRLEKLKEVANAAKNGSMVPIQCDITSTPELEAAAARVKAEMGFVNALFANSALLGPPAPFAPANPLVTDPSKKQPPTIAEIQSHILSTPQSTFTETYAVNNTATFYTLMTFLSLLDAGNKSEKSPTPPLGIKSQFITTSSIGAFDREPSAGFAYGSSKAAANHLSKMLAKWLVPYHIRCNVIAPGIYPSEMNKVTDLVDGVKEGAYEQSAVPLTRAGNSQDMAAAVLSLCGRGGAYYNGLTLVTDGGRLCVMTSTY